MVMEDIEYRIKCLEASVNQIIRQGIVTQTNPERGTVRVQLPDADAVVTKELPVLFQRSFENKAYDMPDVDEQVVCIFLPNGMEQGFVIGSLYSDVDPVPVADQDIKHYVFKDGTWIEYDRKNHILRADVRGRVDVFADDEITVESLEHVRATAPRIDLNPY